MHYNDQIKRPLVALTACSKKTEAPANVYRPPEQSQKPLSAMSVSDALRTKYNYATLRCYVGTALSESSDETRPGRTISTSDYTQIKLIDSLTFPREIHLQSGSSAHHFIQMTVTLRKLELAQGRLIQATGATYRFFNSPQITAEAVINTEYWPNDTSPIRGQMHLPVTIHEQVESLLLDSKSGLSQPNDKRVWNKAGCVIDAQAKPGFESEFVIEK